MQTKLTEKLNKLPSKPGVYIFKNAKGLFLYVGKAINLHNRVRSYFMKDAGLSSTRIQSMVSQISDLDYTVTDNELESLLLENNFIKQLRPKYNVRLRDDKNYVFIKISIQDQIPTITFERKPADLPAGKAGKSARYFGPYTSSVSVKETLRLLRRIFPYCANKKIGNRPCFFYHIGKCPGVCIGKVSLDDYRKNHIAKIVQFLEGKQSKILKYLKLQMQGYARGRLFEKAAKARDQIFALNRVLERQKLVYPKKIDQDVFSIHAEGSVACVNLFIIREGKLIRKDNFILENTKEAGVSEILEEFLPKYYLDASDWPKEILVPSLEGSLEGHPPRLALNWEGAPPIKILVSSRGPKLKLIKLGEQNAKEYLESQSDKQLLEEAKLLSSLKELQRVLNLEKLPGRIEAFDISNIQGKNPVGSMVVFDFGRPKKEDYRKFKIKLKDTPDDYVMIREVLERRFRKTITINDNNNKNWPLPDLILIDGGKGQVNAAVAAISNFKFLISKQIPIIGLAKRLEEIFLRYQKNPVVLPKNSIALFLLQRIRDEAHRFAVTYHRKLRSKHMTKSRLDQIPGIGPKNKKKLLDKFSSFAKIKQASFTELANVVGRKSAEKIKASL